MRLLKRLLRWLSMVVLAVMLVCGLLFIAAALGGCATTDSYWQDGVLTLRSECPSAVNSEANRRKAGCAITTPTRVNFDPDGTEGSHERDHQLGMRHGDWVPGFGSTCAEVLVAGNTRWIVGRLICKEGNVYVQR